MSNAARKIVTFPYLRMVHMPNDSDDDMRASDTLAPSTDREPAEAAPITQPPGAADAIAAAVMSDRLPRDPKVPSTVKELAEKELVTLYRTAIGMHESLLGASGLLEQNRLHTVEDIAVVVDRGFDRVVQRLEPRLDAQGQRIAKLEEQVSAMQRLLDQARLELDDLKAHRDSSA